MSEEWDQQALGGDIYIDWQRMAPLSAALYVRHRGPYSPAFRRILNAVIEP